MGKEKIKALVEGGKASPGPPLAPALSPLGIDIKKVISDINAATKDFEGIKVPIEVVVDTETKEFQINVGSPPTSQLIFKELKLQKGSGSAWKEGNPEKPAIAGDASKELIVKIAKIKNEPMGTKTLKNAVKNILGTCISAGITIEGKNPKEAIAEVNKGDWDSLIQ